MLNISLNEALAAGASLRPENVGESITGTIIAVEVKPYTDYQSGKPDFWEDGTPKTQIVVSLNTGETEGAIYIKNWGAQRTNLVAAVKATGLDPDKALAPGNGFTVTFQGEEPNQKNPRFNATKIYTYKIEPRANLGAALDTQPATPTAPAGAGAAHDPWAVNQTPPPAFEPAAPAPAPAPAGPAGNVAQLIQAGLDDAQIAQVTGLDPAVVATLRAAN